MRKISIVNETGDPFGTKIIDSQTGYDFARNATSVRINIEACEFVTAEVTLGVVPVNVKAAAGTFLMPHPVTNELVEVAKVTFADGTTLEF